MGKKFKEIFGAEIYLSFRNGTVLQVKQTDRQNVQCTCHLLKHAWKLTVLNPFCDIWK